MKKWFLKAVVFLLVPAGSFAFELGVGTHVGQGRNDLSVSLARIRQASLTSFRDEIYWYDLERTPGRFFIDGRALMTEAYYISGAQAGLRPMIVLGYGNSLYDNGSQPHSEKGLAAFEKYAGWISGRLGKSVSYVEIWNEWNIGSGTRPKVRVGDPAAYVRLVDRASRAIRAANPSAKVVVGGVGDDFGGWPWLTRAMDLGVLDFADALSVHLYNYSAPVEDAGADEMVERLRDLQRRVRTYSKGRKIPLLVTEMGWPTHLGPKGVLQSEASRELAKFLVAARSLEDLGGVWIYELWDGGDDSSDKEHRFGLVSRDFREKPGGCRLRSIAAFVQRAVVIQAFRTDRAVGYVLNDSDRTLVAAWRQRKIPGGLPLVLKVRVGSGSIEPLGGNCRDGLDLVAIRLNAGEAEIDVGSSPSFFWVNGTNAAVGITE